MSGSRRGSNDFELTLSIGGLVGRVELRGGTAPFLEQLLARYAAFLLPQAGTNKPDFSLLLQIRSAQPPGANRPTLQPQPLSVIATEKRIAIARSDLSVRLRAEGRTRRASFLGTGWCEMNP